MSYITDSFDVIVVGAGHAGVEAALAAARLGGKTLLATLSLDNVALMPCNPSIGGPAKGHLVRELDALGGQMGISADLACIQMRLLNTGKGYAVHALRGQEDKPYYHTLMKKIVEEQENLELKQLMIDKLLVENGQPPEWLEVEDVTSPGECLTLNIGECPSAENESFLSQILETRNTEIQRYYLSPKACQGILRRAEMRGKELPPELKTTLERQAVLSQV